MHIALPLYVYPSDGSWQPLYDALNAFPEVVFDVIINPNSGPGGSPPDSNYVANISALNTYENVNMFGYVHTSYGSRLFSDIAVDIDTYESWSAFETHNIALGGIFVDETPASVDCFDYVNDIYIKIKTTMSRGNLVWTNPGVPVDPSYYSIADIVNAYENSFDQWSNHGGDSCILTNLHNRSSVLLHQYAPSDISSIASDVERLMDAGYYSALLITNEQYTEFGNVWPKYASSINEWLLEGDC
ncbi:hypothetical protein KCV07_g9846, partial [Aureobasidium melanogenum]